VTTTSNPTSERDGAIADHAQDLLKLTLRYTGRGPTGGDPTSRNAHYFTAINSWTAYRLLRALQQVDPDLLGQWAWDEAEKAGHDPEAWSDEYEAHLKKLAAEAVAP
jgi:hypothetical protein